MSHFFEDFSEIFAATTNFEIAGTTTTPRVFFPLTNTREPLMHADASETQGCRYRHLVSVQQINSFIAMRWELNRNGRIVVFAKDAPITWVLCCQASREFCGAWG